MSVRATPVAKSVPMCMAPTSAIAAADSSSVTSMAFHVKVSSVVLQREGGWAFLIVTATNMNNSM